MKYFFLLCLFLFAACTSSRYPLTSANYQFPKPVDTTTRPIDYQEKKVYTIDGVSASNDFPAARLNNFSQLNDSTFQATISPENSPINASPWYAFQIWATAPRNIYLKLHYTEHKHRYAPKVSDNGNDWQLLDEEALVFDADDVDVTLQLELSTKPLWLAAQEIQDHKRVGEWVNKMGQNPLVQVGTAGQSVQGRSIYYIEIGKGELKKKPTVIVISRQHPPEVTGYLAMRAFIEKIISEGDKNGFLDNFRLMVYPLMNPDGVDLGHHRHNTGGIDMNRDWANYHQPEIRQAVDHMVSQTSMFKNNVVLGLDFHSTHYDVYYTYDDTVERKLPGFTKAWLQQIQNELQLEDINEQPSGFAAPISKGWFNKQFGAESITYEIGDDTPRDFIRAKGEVSATAMMEILMRDGKKWGLKIKRK